MQSIGGGEETEMYRSFNMRSGMVFITRPDDVSKIESTLKDLSPIFLMGSVISGNQNVIIK